MKPNPYLYKMLRNTLSPKIVEEGDGYMFIGDCLPDCTKYDERKWLIKLVATDAETGLQRILYANGSERYNQAWTDRRLLEYKPTPAYIDEVEPETDVPNGALCDENNVPIITIDNQFIIAI